MCIDYRKLNQKLVKDKFSVTYHRRCFRHTLQEAKVYSTLDLRNGFFQVDVDEDCRNYILYRPRRVAAVAEWYRYRIVACLVTSSIPVPLKTRRVGQRCTLNLSRAE
ncbi:hypothetical protein TNCV_4931711 [Trichonephila clavipes]|nr:hypothetical protein TNCV_4931711 [Trichonephila clavipes]